MKKGKKISVKAFLNKNYPWKTTKELPDGSSEEVNLYPVYMQITYNRKNTQFKSSVNEHVSDLSEIIGESKIRLENELKFYAKIVEYETNKLGDNFQLKGINDRFDKYVEPIISYLGETVNKDYYHILVKTRSEHALILANVSGFNVTFNRLMNTTKVLIPNFDSYCDSSLIKEFISYGLYTEIFPKSELISKNQNYPRVIDFLDGSFQNLFKQKLIAKKLYNESEINDFVSTINSILETTIKV